jgi:hypothetical protein
MQRNEVSICIISRSDEYPNGVFSIAPGKTPRETTYQQAYTKGGYFRNDIALVNIFFADGSHEQYAVYPGEDGEPDWSGNKKYFSAKQIDELRAENKRMVALARQYPEYKRAMRL